MEEMITYANPVLPGFYSDPSICRVGQDYYLVTSSFEYFPGVPIFHSRDLIHWRQIGHCLTRASQLPLENVPGSGGIFAPTIRYHRGTFYMITTNISHGGNFYVHTQDPGGAWSEPVWVQQEGIDPSLCFDGEHVYLTTAAGWPQKPEIYQCEIAIESGHQLTETRLLWGGTGGRFPEGPHLYHIGNWYYLMIAEGGTEYGHMETLARSRSPWGPFEACPRNPILTQRDSGTHPLQGAGHADLVEAHDGSWWLVFHAIRPQEGQFHHLGRETCLTPVTWTEDGWFGVFPEKTVDVQMKAPTLPWQVEATEEGRDDFDGPQLPLYWNFLRNPNAHNWSLSERPGWLRLYGSPLTLDDQGSPAFIGRRQRHFAVSAKTLLDFRPESEGHEAGLTAYMNEQHHYEIAVTRQEDSRFLIVRRRIGDLVALVAQERIEEGPVALEIRAESESFTFLYALNGQPARKVATGATRYLSSEVAATLTGIYFGLYATSNGNGRAVPADFDWFEYRPT